MNLSPNQPQQSVQSHCCYLVSNSRPQEEGNYQPDAQIAVPQQAAHPAGLIFINQGPA
jgi:hypothetical protein